MNTSMRQSNPQDTTLSIMQKSFLKRRQQARESGSKFFQENKIRSCSYVKQTKDGFKAIPFYQKRDNTKYPTASQVTRSWTSNVHKNREIIFAGMGSTKPLVSYNPNEERNLIHIPDFRPRYPNSSQIQFGNRNQRDTKHYKTTYGNSFIENERKLPSIHPGIEASRNQWTLSRLRK